MKRLFTIDLQDYDPSWTHSIRPSVRAIIRKNGMLALIHNGKYPGIWLGSATKQ